MEGVAGSEKWDESGFGWGRVQTIEKYRSSYVLFPENRETNCLSTKVEPITEMLSKITNSNAYIRLNLGSYSMWGIIVKITNVL